MLKKTKVLQYFSCNQENFLTGQEVYLDNVNLEVVKVYTYLGIRLDSWLSMKDHLDYLYRAAMSMVFALAHIRKYIDTRSSLLIFKAHILSRVEYGSELCIGANKVHLDRLQKLINKSSRICLYKPRDSNVFDMHVEAKLLPLKICRNIASMKLMFGRIRDKKLPLVTTHKRARTRGDFYLKLPIPFPNSSWFQRSVTYLTI